MKVLILIIILINLSFASNANVSLMNGIKNIIQKEEYIALAINKYILQTGKIPKNEDNKTLNWDVLMVDDYLGENFDKTNPLTSKDMVVEFTKIDELNEPTQAYIKGILEEGEDYEEGNKYLYNFYINKIFRVNTISPKDNTETELKKGSQVLYNDIQKEIVEVLNEIDIDKKRNILFPNQDCNTDITTSSKEFYELKNEKLTLKYCKSEDFSFDIYQNGPIYLDGDYDAADLQKIIANVGDKAYVGFSEYIYQGDVEDIDQGDKENNRWVEITKKEKIGEEDYTSEQVLSYIPNAKDLVIRKDGGCMLAKGDIYCWGNNDYKKAGIETYGQIDTTLSPDYVNTPIMLKVFKSDGLYNSSQRVKFVKIALNSTNVCGISTAGDMYCNGNLNSTNFDISATGETSILRKNKNVSSLKDLAMVNGAWVLLDNAGKIYTLDSNGANRTLISGTKTFKKIYALRDSKTFGALDDSDKFYIWGERGTTTIATPSLVSNSIKFDEDRIFVNSKEFTLKGLNGNYYRTSGNNSIVNLNIPSSALSVSYYVYNARDYILYIDEKMQLQIKGTNTLLSCKDEDLTTCDNAISNTIFSTAFNDLNTVKKDKTYAKFSNVSIFASGPKLSDSTINAYFDANGKYLEDFEDKVFSDWRANGVSIPYASNNTGIPIHSDTIGSATNFLGRFGDTLSEKNSITQDLNKRYNFGSAYANKTIKISFDFYRIDNWVGNGSTNGLLTALLGGLGTALTDLLNNVLGLLGLNIKKTTDIFIPYINGSYIKSSTEFWWTPYIHNTADSATQASSKLDSVETPALFDKNISGTNNTKDVGFSFKEIEVPLDENGSIQLGFSVFMDSYCNSTLLGLGIICTGFNNRSIADSSWGIDNVEIKLVDTSFTPLPFVCAMTGIATSTQMYCWGNVARGIPILSTSLYDVSKISDMNNLFISKDADKAKQMSFDEYNNKGNLFLKYPTYIGGFDYEFYFK